MKTFITILGPGASGKTTLMRAIAGVGPATEFDSGILNGKRNAKFSIFKSGVAVVGNEKVGEDATNMSPLIRTQILVNLLKDRRVNTIIRDGVMVSKIWNVDWLNARPEKFAALFVYFDLSEEENVRRLLKRRQANGKKETELPEKTYRNMLAFRGRAEGVFIAARSFYHKQPAAFIVLPETDDSKTCAKEVWKAVKNLCR